MLVSYFDLLEYAEALKMMDCDFDFVCVAIFEETQDIEFSTKLTELVFKTKEAK